MVKGREFFRVAPGDTTVQIVLLSSGKFSLFGLCLCLGNPFYSSALCTHFTVKYSENIFNASICTKNVQTPVLTVQVVHRCVFMVRMVYVAVV